MKPRSFAAFTSACEEGDKPRTQRPGGQDNVTFDNTTRFSPEGVAPKRWLGSLPHAAFARPWTRCCCVLVVSDPGPHPTLKYSLSNKAEAKHTRSTRTAPRCSYTSVDSTPETNK